MISRAEIRRIQSLPDDAMVLMARAAELGGARALRVNGPADVAAVLAATSLPVMAINKVLRYDGIEANPNAQPVDMTAAFKLPKEPFAKATARTSLSSMRYGSFAVMPVLFRQQKPWCTFVQRFTW